MMYKKEPCIINFPNSLNYQGALQFGHTLQSLPDGNEYIFDFNQLKYVKPFGMLYVSNFLKHCKRVNKNSSFSARNFKHLTYAAHMGFFESFGLKWGSKPGEAKGNESYIPITFIETKNILDEALKNYEDVGETVEKHSNNMAKVLSRNNKDNGLIEILTYSIREIIRNSIEHSESANIGFCAQYWEGENKVELTLIDNGIGIHKSLKQNPYCNMENDQEALKLALMPGISGKVYKGKRQKIRGEWENSGYGLFMISQLCLNGGSFLVTSGDSAIFLNNTNKNFTTAWCNGTAIRLVLDINKIYDLSENLRIIRNKGYKIAETFTNINLNASKASQMLSKDFKKYLP